MKIWYSAVALAVVVFFGFFLWLNVFGGHDIPPSPSQKVLDEKIETVNLADDDIGQYPLPAVPDRENDPVSILFVGDIMLGRYVETLMDEKGADYPFEKIDSFLSNYDLVVSNLEGPIVSDHSQTPNDSLRFSFEPAVADLLARHFFDAVSVANNHAFDQGETGFQQTRQILATAGVFSFGHGRDPSVGDVFTLPIDNHSSLVILGFHATSSAFSTDKAIARIQEQIAASPDDFVVVFIHWGSEYVLHSNSFQQKLAHAFIDAGASGVIGHHPHVTQEVELYHDRLIFYSLGNFIFDQYFSKDTQEGLAVTATFDQDVRYELFPLESVRSQPRLMEEKKSSTWLTALAERSDPALFESVKAGIIMAEY